MVRTEEKEEEEEEERAMRNYRTDSLILLI